MSIRTIILASGAAVLGAASLVSYLFVDRKAAPELDEVSDCDCEVIDPTV